MPFDCPASWVIKGGGADILAGEDIFSVIPIVGLALFFGFTNGFHDAANVAAGLVVTGAVTPRMALVLAAVGEFGGPFLFGTAVAQTMGKGIIDLSAFQTSSPAFALSLIGSALGGAVVWNLITWYRGLPSSSSHALIGGLIGPVLIAYGAGKINWQSLAYIIAVLMVSPLLSLIFGTLFLKLTLRLSRNATPKANTLFNRLQVLSAVVLALGQGANDAQKPMAVIMMTLAVFTASSGSPIPLWVTLACAAAIAIGTLSGGWRIVKTVGVRIYRLRSVHAFCSQTASAFVILAASLLGGPVSTTHVVSSSIMGVGAGQRLSAVRWGVAKTIVIAWFITIPASAVMAGAIFLAMGLIRPGL
jgi:inorganic phosphate transporter, PiT family